MFKHSIEFLQNTLVDKMTVTEKPNLNEIVYGYMRSREALSSFTEI